MSKLPELLHLWERLVECAYTSRNLPGKPEGCTNSSLKAEITRLYGICLLDEKIRDLPQRLIEVTGHKLATIGK